MMGEISADAFKRLWATCLIGRFPGVAYGHMHVQQVNFYAEREATICPVAVHYHHHGPFSPQLADVMEQLLAMNYLTVAPLTAREGDARLKNQYSVGAEPTYKLARRVIADVSPELVAAVDRSVDAFAARTEDELLAQSHHILKEGGHSPGAVVLPERLPRRLAVSFLPDDACRALELALDPVAMRLARVLPGATAPPA